jgi:hypothetical protein
MLGGSYQRSSRSSTVAMVWTSWVRSWSCGGVDPVISEFFDLGPRVGEDQVVGSSQMVEEVVGDRGVGIGGRATAIGGIGGPAGICVAVAA